MSQLPRIQLFGRLSIVGPSGALIRLRTRFSKMLVAYLAIKSGEEVSREALIDAIWPEVHLPVGRNRLNTELSYLRSSLQSSSDPFSGFEVDRHSVRLRSDSVSVDYSDALEAVRRTSVEGTPLANRIGALDDAIRIAKEPLLSELSADWIASESARFDSALIQAALGLSRSLRSAGDASSALKCIQAALTRVGSEALSLAELRLASESHRHADTISAFERHKSYLEAEYGSTPSSEAVELVEQARRNLAKGGLRALQKTLEQTAQIPQPIDRFIGRERETKQLSRLIEKHRLVTIVGIGGVGKTRLMLQLCRQKVDRRQLEVAWISLSEVGDASGMVRAIVEAFGHRDASGRGIELAISILKDRKVALALDNFEHLPEDCSGLLGILLNSTELLTCIVSSRRPVGLSGEAVFRLHPLELPTKEMDASQRDRCESVQFLVDRIRHARPGFSLDESNAASAARVCARLDGLPLALELIAARFGVLGEVEIEEELSNPARLLVSRDVNRQSRHMSLEATVAWNYEVLSETARQVLDHLCVFVGPCDLPTIRAILPGEGLVESLDELHAMSMLLAEPKQGRMRFALLQTIRDVVQAQIGPTRLKEMRSNHAAHFAQATSQARQQLTSSRSSEVADSLDANFAEILAAIDHLIDEDAALAVRVLVDLEHFWRMRDRQAEILPRFRRVASLRVPEAARALRAYAFLAHVTGKLDEARSVIQLAYEGAKEIADTSAIAASALLLSFPPYSSQRWKLLDEAEKAAKQSPIPWAPLIQIEKAVATWQSGDWVKGKEMALVALTVADETRCDWLIAYLLHEVSYMQVQAFELLDAKASILRHFDVMGRVSGGVTKTTVAPMLGSVELYLGSYDDARQIVMAGIESCRELGLYYAVANELSRLAAIESKCLMIEEALVHEIQATKMREEIRFPGYQAATAVNRARIAFYAGDWNDVQYWLHTAKLTIDELDSPLYRLTSDWLTALMQIERENFKEARAIALGLASMRDKQGNFYGTAEALDTAAYAMAHLGEIRKAAELAKHAAQLRDRVLAKVPPADEIWRKNMLDLVSAGLTAQAIEEINRPDVSAQRSVPELLKSLEIAL